MEARALDAKQQALAHEAARVSGLLDGGFVSPNEAEQKEAESASRQAEVLAQRAKLASTSLEVGDCILRAPFDGEIADRMIDPGAFVRPGAAIIALVDRSTVRVSTDVPEGDFNVIAPGTPVTVRALATGTSSLGTISRRAPAADPGTRTVHFEVDLPDPDRRMPVGTTGEIGIDVGEPVSATEVPLASASVRGNKATLYVIDGRTAHKVIADVLGESGGSLFVAPTLRAGAQVVTQGRAALSDGDAVAMNAERPAEKATR
jgi:RND family efflux transporter MFP subunit